MSYEQMVDDPDVIRMKEWIAEDRVTDTVAAFVAGNGIEKLNLNFDIQKLREALEQVLKLSEYQGEQQDQGFAAIPLSRRPGEDVFSGNDLSGRYWLRATPAGACAA